MQSRNPSAPPAPPVRAVAARGTNHRTGTRRASTQVLVRAGCLLLTGFLLAGCAGSSPIRIGFSGCLTGFSSGTGVNGRYGAELAVDDINAAGGIRGRPIELLVRDDRNDADAAHPADQQLHDAGVLAIVGHMTSDMGATTIPWANEERVLMMSPTMSDPTLTGKDDWFFRVIPENEAQARWVSQGMRDLGFRKAAVLYENKNLAFSQRLAEAFDADFRSRGGTVSLMQSFTAESAADFEPLLDALDADKPDAVFFIASSDRTVLFLQMRAKRAVRGEVFLAMWSFAGGFLSQAGPTAEGVFLVDVVDPHSQAPAYRTFVDAYTRKYGAPPNFASVFAYESVMVLAEAMRSAGGRPDGAAIRKEILRRRTFKGLQGDITFSPNGDVDRDMYLFTIKDGAIEAVSP